MLFPRTASVVLSEDPRCTEETNVPSGIIVAILAFLLIAFVGYLAIR
jgi:hypothetical protein